MIEEAVLNIHDALVVWLITIIASQVIPLHAYTLEIKGGSISMTIFLKTSLHKLY